MQNIKKALPIILFLLLFLSGHLTLCPAQQDDGRNDYYYAKRLLDEGYFDLAAEQFERVLRDNPGLSEAEEAQFLLGESWLKAGNFKQARAAYLKLAIVFPESPHAPESMFKVAFSLEKLELPMEAAQAYKRVPDFYPQSTFATDCLAQALRLYQEVNDLSEAEVVADQLIQKYSASEAADLARFYKAERHMARGDQSQAIVTLARVVERSAVDSLAAKALLNLGRIFRENLEYDSAIEYLKHAIKRDSQSLFSMQTRIELADLLNSVSLLADALDVLEPILKDPNHPLYNSAVISAGDSHFLQGDYAGAFSMYKQSPDGEVKLKAALTAEKAGRVEVALEIYLQLADSPQEKGINATIRAAQLAGMTGNRDLAILLWTAVVNDPAHPDLSGRAVYELAMLLYESDNVDTLRSIHALRDRAISYMKNSPYADDILYIEAKALEKAGLYSESRSVYQSLTEKYPASLYADSALVAIVFLDKCRIRSPELVDKMAELSSNRTGGDNPTQWALSWGDFYLNDFKDPVKAIDQYDRVLEDTLFKDDLHSWALFNSVTAYLRLYQIALRERDTVGVEIYSDSTYARMTQLTALLPESQDIIDLQSEIFYANLSRNLVSENPWQDDNCDWVNNNLKDFVFNHQASQIPSFLVIEYLSHVKDYGVPDSLDLAKWLITVREIQEFETDPGRLAALNLMEAHLLTWQIGMSAVQSDSLAMNVHTELENKYISINKWWKNTSSGAEALWWLVGNSSKSTVHRLELLNNYTKQYYYLMDAEIVARLKSELLESSGRLFEAIAADNIADSLGKWGQPAIDIQSISSESARLRLSEALMSADSLHRASLELRHLLNMAPDGEFAPQALLNLAKIMSDMEKTEVALSYLDTLDNSFPFSKSAAEGAHLRPALEFSLGKYQAAYDGFKSLSGSSTDSDSLFLFESQAVVCLYRLNRLEQAFSEAKNLYKTYRKRADLEDIKALFYLEKGRSHDHTRQFEEARRQYEVVMEKYPLSPSVDDASYAYGLSLIGQNKFEEGASWLERFTENYPESELKPNVQLSLGLAYLRAEKYSEAMTALKQAWQDSSTQQVWKQSFQALLKTYRDLRFWDAAITLNRQYLQRYPDAADLLDRKMDIAQMYFQIGEWDEAIRNYKPLLPIADAESEAEIQYYIGEACYNKSDFRTAILEFLKVPVLGRKTKLDWGVTAIYKAGDCYEKLGDQEGAARMYRRIIRDTGETSNYGRAAQKQLDLLEMKSNE